MPPKTTFLDSEAFGALLDFLDADREAAGDKFQSLRRRLVKLFEVRGARFPEDLADETISRVAGKVGKGLKIEAQDPFRYFCGVAFLVFKEVTRGRSRELAAMEDLRFHPAQELAEADERLPHLQRCLENLPKDNHQLILSYHQGEKGERISNRRRLADALGVTATALRIRAHRIRLALESCVEQGLSADSA
ncbi:MAG: hypothetical protein K0U98_03130 [Deltaproteobacteria bacterium]|nr:hypothetical protein [Deltaproteobacteria bacterium]